MIVDCRRYDCSALQLKRNGCRLTHTDALDQIQHFLRVNGFTIPEQELRKLRGAQVSAMHASLCRKRWPSALLAILERHGCSVIEAQTASV